MPRFVLARRQQYHRLADRAAARLPLVAFVTRGALVAESMGFGRRSAAQWSRQPAPAASVIPSSPAMETAAPAPADQFGPAVWAQPTEAAAVGAPAAVAGVAEETSLDTPIDAAA